MTRTRDWCKLKIRRWTDSFHFVQHLNEINIYSVVVDFWFQSRIFPSILYVQTADIAKSAKLHKYLGFIKDFRKPKWLQDRQCNKVCIEKKISKLAFSDKNLGFRGPRTSPAGKISKRKELASYVNVRTLFFIKDFSTQGREIDKYMSRTESRKQLSRIAQMIISLDPLTNSNQTFITVILKKSTKNTI